MTMPFNPSFMAVRRCLCHTANSSSHWPYSIHSTNPATFLKSKFQGHASHCPPTIAQSQSNDLNHILESLSKDFPSIKRATHCMFAWRVRAPNTQFPRAQNVSAKTSPSTSHTQGTILSGCNDGNEPGAGERLSRLLELGGYEDVIVIVHRWYGGVKLGSDRWKCISGAAKEALELGGFQRGGGQPPPSPISSSENPTGRNKKGRKR